jgi:hypothetical protein
MPYNLNHCGEARKRRDKRRREESKTKREQANRRDVFFLPALRAAIARSAIRVDPVGKKRAGWSHHSPPNGGSSVSIAARSLRASTQIRALALQTNMQRACQQPRN